MAGYKKLFSNTLVMTIGQFSNKILAFLLVPLYTSILSTDEYGVFELITTTVTLLSPFLTMVISEAVMRFCLDRNYDNRQVLTIGVCLVLLGSAILAAAYPIIRLVDALADYYLWLLAFFLLTNLDNVLLQYLKGTDKVKTYAACGILSTVVNLTLNIVLLVVFEWGIVGYMLSSIITRAATVVVIFLSQRLWRAFVNPFRIPKSTYGAIAKYSVPLIPNSVSWWISDSSDKYMVAAFISTAATGVYAVAYKIPTILTLFTTVFISAFQISSYENFGSRKTEKFISDLYRLFAAGNIMVSAVLIAISYPLAKILFQSDFFEAWQSSAVLVFAYTFNALSSYIGTIYTAAKRTGFILASTVTAALVNIVANVFLIRWMGILGAAAATLLSYFVVWLCRVIHSRKIMPLRFNVVGNVISFLLLALEIFLVIYFDTAFCLWAVLVALAIIAINSVDVIKSEPMRNLIGRLTGKKGRTAEDGTEKISENEETEK